MTCSKKDSGKEGKKERNIEKLTDEQLGEVSGGTPVICTPKTPCTPYDPCKPKLEPEWPCDPASCMPQAGLDQANGLKRCNPSCAPNRRR